MIEGLNSVVTGPGVIPSWLFSVDAAVTGKSVFESKMDLGWNGHSTYHPVANNACSTMDMSPTLPQLWDNLDLPSVSPWPCVLSLFRDNLPLPPAPKPFLPLEWVSVGETTNSPFSWFSLDEWKYITCPTTFSSNRGKNSSLSFFKDLANPIYFINKVSWTYDRDRSFSFFLGGSWVYCFFF